MSKLPKSNLASGNFGHTRHFGNFDRIGRGVRGPGGGGRSADTAISEHTAYRGSEIDALVQAGADLLKPGNRDQRELVRDLIDTEQEREALASRVSMLLHTQEHGRHRFTLVVNDDRNRAAANEFGRDLQRHLEVPMVRHEDPHDLTRFADRKQSQPGRADFGREKHSLPHRPTRRGY